MIKKKKFVVLDDLDFEIEDDAETTEQDDEDLENGIVLIHSKINSTLWESVIRPLHKLERDEDIEKIQIYLSTPGGTLYDGFTFCDVIDRITKPTTVTLFGEVQSCGFVMGCAGYNNPKVRTVCYPSVIAMAHSPFIMRYQDEPVNTKTLDDLGNLLVKHQDMVYDYIVSHSKITREMLDEMLKKDYYMDAKELLKYGVVDEIL